MGGLYAKLEGAPAAVHRAIYEHYQPGSLEDASPASLSGAILSIADKMDSIVGAIGVGLQVSGSSDPFGLRRNAHGVCKVALDRKILADLAATDAAAFAELVKVAQDGLKAKAAKA